MADTLVNYRIPNVPDAGTVKAARSLASWQPIASGVVHLIGWRFRRMTTHQVTWTTGDGYRSVLSGASDTRRIRIRPAPSAVYLHVTITYQAHDEESGGSQIEINLYTIAGVLVDGPVTFDSTLGTLPTQTIAIGDFVGSDNEAPFLTVHNGVAESPPTVDRPRLLYVNGAADARNVDSELRVTATNARIRSVTIWELAIQEI